MPAFTSFVTRATATFFGTGIPNPAVAITHIGGVTHGLTATQRFTMPVVTNNGAGVFHAANDADDSGGKLAKWNFDFHLGGTGGGDYGYTLFVDYTPAMGNHISTACGRIQWSAQIPASCSPKAAHARDHLH